MSDEKDESDRELDKASDYMKSAVKCLSRVVGGNTAGSDLYSKDYRQDFEEALCGLVQLVRKLDR